MGDGSGVMAAVTGVQYHYPAEQTMAGASHELLFTQGVR